MLRIGGRVMTYKVCVVFTISLGVALSVASSQTFGQAGVAQAGARSVSASTDSPFHRSVARSPHFNNARNIVRNNVRNRGTFLPTTGGFFFGPSNGQPNAEVMQPMGAVSGDFTYTYKQDFPWDWAHRYPPSLFASPPEPLLPPIALRPGCPAQTVTVPGADGK